MRPCLNALHLVAAILLSKSFYMSAPTSPILAEIPKVKKTVLSRDTSPFRNFATVWAIATLFHMAHSGVFDTRLNFALLTLSAIYVIFRPSMSGFLVLVMLQLLDVAVQMPNPTNHWIFTAFVNLTILQSVLWCIIRNKSFEVDEMEVYNTFAPIVRWEVMILYFWAVFHKLNFDFFSPEASCASTLLEAQRLGPLLTYFPQFLSLNPYFTILVELAIPVMLFFPRTRHLGIIVGLFFHLILSYSTYNAFFDFTSMVIAAYFLFAHSEFHRRADQWRNQLRERIKSILSGYSFSRLIGICMGAVFLMGVVAVLNKKLYTFKEFHLYFFWTLYAVIIAYVLVRFLFNTKATYGSAFALKSKWFLILPVIVFLNGASPYLGLKTENSYSMFSNLRTEGAVSNHFIIPASAQIFDFQSNLVEIISTTDERLERLVERGEMMVLFEFKRYLMKYDVDEVVYRLNGKLDVYRKGETPLAGLLEPDAAILYRIMRFRNVSMDDQQPCAH